MEKSLRLGVMLFVAFDHLRFLERWKLKFCDGIKISVEQ